jgi:hypothetical protein
MSGSARVRDLKTGKTIQVAAGEVKLVNLRTSEMNVPIAQLASLAPPTSLPAGLPAPQGPAGTGGGVNWAVWGPVLAGIGAGAVTGIYFAVRDSSPSRP